MARGSVRRFKGKIKLHFIVHLGKFVSGSVLQHEHFRDFENWHGVMKDDHFNKTSLCSLRPINRYKIGIGSKLEFILWLKAHLM